MTLLESALLYPSQRVLTDANTYAGIITLGVYVGALYTLPLRGRCVEG